MADAEPDAEPSSDARRRRFVGWRIPPWTVRARLTLLYGVVFLVTGTILLTLGYFLVHHNLDVRLNAENQRGLTPQPLTVVQRVEHEMAGAYRRQLIRQTLHQLLLYYSLALLAMTAVSVVAGWLLAGRALAPLRAITAAARRVSGENLGERISLTGPEDELKLLADTFDGMLSRLDAAFASQRHFVANASHELRTPLAIMGTEVDVALADPGASIEDLRDMGEALRESIDRSEGLIAALLALARAETVSVAEQTVDLAMLVGDCITDLHRRAVAVDVTIEEELEPALVSGDPALLERMAANLIENGIRHNISGGRLIVRTDSRDHLASLVVANSGVVINPEQVPSLTEPFRRLSRQSGGFGLGLSIVASVVRAHGGKLNISAPVTGGLEIRVDLTAATSPQRAVKRQQPPVADATHKAPSRR